MHLFLIGKHRLECVIYYIFPFRFFDFQLMYIFMKILYQKWFIPNEMKTTEWMEMGWWLMSPFWKANFIQTFMCHVYFSALPFDTSSHTLLCAPPPTTFDTKSISQEFLHSSSLDSNSNANDYRSSLDKMNPITNSMCVCVCVSYIQYIQAFSFIFQLYFNIANIWNANGKPTQRS